jgi:predicted ATPase/DNA-binding winged helix-turn-helix (wHTH) protein
MSSDPSNPVPLGHLRFGRFTLDLAGRALVADGAPIEIGARAFDLLNAFVQKPGRLLTKAELFAAAWPGVTVDENNLQVQVSALRKILGVQMIATLPGRGYQFTVAVTKDGAMSAPLAPTPRLFGRTDDGARLQALLGAYRMVTVIGPAGVGKTALARVLAQSGNEQLKGNVAFVELAPVANPSLVPAAVAGALGLKLQIGPAAEQIAAHFGASTRLLILDNCEHQIAAVAALVDALLRAAPALHILATSQARLSLADENVYALAPLPPPTDTTLYSVEQSPAAGLFAARISQTAPHFELTDANAALVCDICTRLDGIPLALELAAARVSLLGLEGVRARLDQRLKLLTKGQHGASARHLTLRAALEWSYDLLSAPEQFVFRCLSVFRGGFTGSDVQAVASNDSIDEWAALDALSALIDRSLVARKAGGDPSAETRFTLLESMAEFAAAKSAEFGELDAARARHAAHFAALAVAVGGRRPERDGRVNRDYAPFDLQHDNLRAAFDWNFSHDLAKAFSMGDSMAVFWRLRGHLAEGLTRLEALLATTDPSIGEHARGLVLSSSQGISFETKDASHLESIADKGIALWTVLDDPFELALATSWKGHSYSLSNDFQTALSYYEKGLGLFRRANHPGRIAETLNNIANALVELGRAGEAAGPMTEALAHYLATDDKWGTAFCREVIGIARFATGDLEQCGAEWRAARDGFDQVGHDQRSVLARLNLAALALRSPDAATARALLSDALDRLGERPYKKEISAAIHLGAQYCAQFAGLTDAATLLSGAKHWTKTWSIHLEIPTEFGVAAAEARICDGLNADALASATRAGAGLTAPQALSRARAIVSKELTGPIEP